MERSGILVEWIAHQRIVWVIAGLRDENDGFGTGEIVLQATVDIRSRYGRPAGVVQHKRGACNSVSIAAELRISGRPTWYMLVVGDIEDSETHLVGLAL